MPEIHSIEDLADVINYYEHLVQKWELWGKYVEDIAGGDK